VLCLPSEYLGLELAKDRFHLALLLFRRRILQQLHKKIRKIKGKVKMKFTSSPSGDCQLDYFIRLEDYEIFPPGGKTRQAGSDYAQKIPISEFKSFSAATPSMPGRFFPFGVSVGIRAYVGKDPAGNRF